MNRALPLLLLAAVLAGGLAYFAMLGPGTAPPTDPSGDETVDVQVAETPKEPARATQSNGTAGLASIQADREALAAAQDGTPAKSWEVIPMNERGQLIPAAQVTAKLGSETLEGAGRLTWTQPRSGTWTLVVEAEDQPRYEREVLVPAGEKVRTPVLMGESFKLRGRVIDTNGTVVARMPLYLLPKGVSHPDQSDTRRIGGTAADASELIGGAISVATSASGTFQFAVPKAGEWRISVGKPGEPRWTQPEPRRLYNGGPDQLEVCIPALAQLTVKFDGPEEERPAQITAYRFDPELAARMAEQEASRFQAGPAESLEDMQRRAKEEAMKAGASRGDVDLGALAKAGKDGAAGSYGQNRFTASEGDSGEGTRAGAPLRAPLFEPGWRPVRSTRVEGPETVITDLPGGIDLRFLFVRSRERIATSSPTRLQNARKSVGVLSLPPPPLEATGSSESNLASLSVSVEKESEDERLEAGIVWAYQH